MNSKSLFELKKKNILQILSDDSIKPEQKLHELEIDELFETISIYEAELEAQNKELVEKEKLLYDAKDEYEVLFEFSPVAYFEVDTNFKILKCNNKAKYLFDPQQPIPILHHSFSNFVFKEDIPSYIDLTLLLKSEKKGKANIRLKYKDYMIHAMLNIEKVFINYKERYLISVLDITNEVYQQEVIVSQAKNVAMGEMLSLITHQWKQPLSMVLTLDSMMQLLLENETIDKKLFKLYLDQIEDQVTYMNDTVYDFKHFFEDASEIVTINIKNCIDRAVKFTKPSLTKNNISLDVTYIDAPILTAKGHNNDVCQILINIINNAKDELIHLNGDKRFIEIEVSNKHDTIVCSIKNNGGNIDLDILESIFNKNFTTKGHLDGSGLGLYMSELIVKKHLKGKISVKNLQNNIVAFILEIPIFRE